MSWKDFVKGETTKINDDLKSIDSADEKKANKKVTFKEINDYERNKKRQDKEQSGYKRTQNKMESQGFSNPTRASKHAYKTLQIYSSFDKFANSSALLTTLDISKQVTFNYYNNQLQHNMLLAAQNDERIKQNNELLNQNDKIIDQNEAIISLLSEIANK